MSNEPVFDLIRMDIADNPVLIAYGEIDVLTSPRLHEALSALISTEARSVLVDLANVTFIDSSGLSVLVVAHRHLEEKGGDLRLVSVPESIAYVFSIAGLDDLLRIDPTVEHA